MKEEKHYLALDDDEHRILIRALVDEKTSLMRSRKAADAVDELIVKIGKAPIKKTKILERADCCAR